MRHIEMLDRRRADLSEAIKRGDTAAVEAKSYRRDVRGRATCCFSAATLGVAAATLLMAAPAQAEPCHILEVDGDSVHCVEPSVRPELPPLLPPPLPVRTELEIGI